MYDSHIARLRSPFGVSIGSELEVGRWLLDVALVLHHRAVESLGDRITAIIGISLRCNTMSQVGHIGAMARDVFSRSFFA